MSGNNGGKIKAYFRGAGMVITAVVLPTFFVLASAYGDALQAESEAREKEDIRIEESLQTACREVDADTKAVCDKLQKLEVRHSDDLRLLVTTKDFQAFRIEINAKLEQSMAQIIRLLEARLPRQ